MKPCLDDYEVLSTIGSGSYGSCKKVLRKRDDKVLVWKEVPYGHMSELEKQMLVSEVNILRQLRHAHIVRYHERIIDKSSSTLYIIMEHCEGGDLASVIKDAKKDGRYLEEHFIRQVCLQVGQALHACQGRLSSGQTILHRDLKPANLFLDASGDIKLGDFGLARVLNSDSGFAETFVGTPYYMSPEQVLGQPYTESCDIWALGCVLYEMAALRPPFIADTIPRLAATICEGRFDRLPACFSDDLNALIGRMLSVKSEKRPSTGDLLADPYVVTASSDSINYSMCEDEITMWAESLKAQEKRLKQREQAIKAKELVLDMREKAIRAREEEMNMAAIRQLRKLKQRKYKEKDIEKTGNRQRHDLDDSDFPVSNSKDTRESEACDEKRDCRLPDIQRCRRPPTERRGKSRSRVSPEAQKSSSEAPDDTPNRDSGTLTDANTPVSILDVDKAAEEDRLAAATASLIITVDTSPPECSPVEQIRRLKRERVAPNAMIPSKDHQSKRCSRDSNKERALSTHHSAVKVDTPRPFNLPIVCVQTLKSEMSPGSRSNRRHIYKAAVPTI